MQAPTLPPELSTTSWERLAGAFAKAKPTSVADALKLLQKAYDAVDFEVFDADKLASPADAEERLAQAKSEAERRIRPLCSQVNAVGSAAAKCESQGKTSGAPKPALQAAAAIVRAASTYPTTVERFAEAAQAQIEKRLAELQAQKAQNDDKPEDTPERRRVRARAIDMFRIVKNRPDRKVMYLLCMGHKSSAPYLAPSVNDSLKPLLLRLLRGDTGFKFFRGECIWEDGGYTFVGPRMSGSLARRIENGLVQLTGTRYRVRAREGKARDEGDAVA